MARFTHPGITSGGDTAEGTWTINGGTVDPATLEQTTTQPAFTGDPLFAGNWTRVGNICHFAIKVDMDNITDFGDGQYFLSLPFDSDDEIVFAGGHLHDSTGNDFYSMLGHVNEGEHMVTLWSVASNGRQVPFTYSVPVGIDELDEFSISGTFHILAGSPYYG